MNRLPTFFISHGGGPWPYMPEMRIPYANTALAISSIPASLPAIPKAILVITGHWEAPQFTVSTALQPGMEYDYSGFPEHTYHIRYSAQGSPVLAARVRELMGESGIATSEDAHRGFDHGTFVPLGLMYPDADIPVVLLSLKSGYDPSAHILAGQALQPLRDDGVLIIGSGLTYHNMRGFGRSESMEVSVTFEDYLNDAVTDKDPGRRLDKLLHWDAAPAARAAHPLEDHLLPLMVVAGAAGEDEGMQLFMDTIMNVRMASYRFG